jgi:hypothetical protein
MIRVCGITLKLSPSVLMPAEKFRSVMGHRNITVPIGAPPVATHPKPTDAKAFCSSLQAGAGSSGPGYGGPDAHIGGSGSSP